MYAIRSYYGGYPSREGQIIIHTGGFLQTLQDVKNVVVNVHNGKPVYLRDVAEGVDGPQEPFQYVFFGTGPAAAEKSLSAQPPANRITSYNVCYTKLLRSRR